MSKSKPAIAATSFLHPATKKLVLRGDAVPNTDGVPAQYLVKVKKAKAADK